MRAQGFLLALMCKTLIGSTFLSGYVHMVVNTVPDFSVTLTHIAGTGPIYDSEAMKKFQELSEKRNGAAKRFGVKIVSKWSPTRVHQTHWIIEAPSKKAAEDYFKAVGLAIWNDIEVVKIKMIK